MKEDMTLTDYIDNILERIEIDYIDNILERIEKLEKKIGVTNFETEGGYKINEIPIKTVQAQNIMNIHNLQVELSELKEQIKKREQIFVNGYQKGYKQGKREPISEFLDDLFYDGFVDVWCLSRKDYEKWKRRTEP